MKTKLWISDTTTSNPIKAMKIEKGIKVTTAIIKLLENSLYKNVDKIFNKVCPAVRLANNRTPKETALAK